MKVYTVSEKNGNKIQKRISDILENRKEITFAYLHGSFLSDVFRDIDIAIYLNDANKRDKKDILKYEITLERMLEDEIGLPVDVRVLNNAPLFFQFEVISKGKLLFSKNENLRCDFESLIIVKHHDFNFFRKIYRREALGII